MKFAVGRLALLSAGLWLPFAAPSPLFFSPARAGEPPEKKAGKKKDPGKTGKNRMSKGDLAALSIQLRTVLHHDPTLTSPLERLVAIYRDAGKLDELTGIYRKHLKKYPNDSRALTVLVRLLAATDDPDAFKMAHRAVLLYPRSSYLRYLLYRALSARHDESALDELDRAIALERRPGRKRAWIKLLLSDASAQERRKLSHKNLRALAALAGRSARSRLGVARAMIRFKFHAMALEQLGAAAKASPDPELGVEIQLAAAEAETGLGRRRRAAARLDRLLERLTADYWRRPRVVRLRMALIRTEAERQTMLKGARKLVAARPRDATAALNMARLLDGFWQRREALDVLLAAGRRMPDSAQIEGAILKLFSMLHDDHGRETYLAERMKLLPGRKDIAYRHVKAMLLVGRDKEAFAELDALMRELPAAARLARLLGTARFLRGASLHEEAAEVFERAVKLAPDRPDVRRELAEAYVAAGQRRKARALFRSLTAGRGQTENLLDAAQFMVEQGMFTEAARILRARAAADETDLEVRLLLLRAEAGLDNREVGRGLIVKIRVLADTGARYRRWLEAAADFHGKYRAGGQFLTAEQGRLEKEGGAWTEARLERLLAFAEVVAWEKQRRPAAAMLQKYIDAKPPRAVRIRLLKCLVALLAQDRTQLAAVERTLKALIVEDRAKADEHRAMLAIFYAAINRRDQATPLLERIEIANINDLELLRRMAGIYARSGGGDPAMRIARRLTVLEPADRGNWEDLVNALATAGDETGLRVTLRRLLAGPGKMSIADETRGKLRAHLADSCWRSAVTYMEAGRRGSLEKALGLLESVGTGPGDRERRLWVTWGRALVLLRLGRQREGAECVRELERLAAEDATGARAREITFPDGLSVSLERALAVLKAPPAPKRRAAFGERQGPLPGMRVKWAFDTDAGRPVTAVLPLGKSRTLVRELGGTLYCLNAATGKLLWTRTPTEESKLRQKGQAAAPAPAGVAVGGSTPIVLPTPSGNNATGRWGSGRRAVIRWRGHGRLYVPQPQPVRRARRARSVLAGPAKLLAAGDGRVLIPGPARVECISAKDGRILWRAKLTDGGESSGATPPPARLFLRGEDVLAFEPASCSLTCLSRSGGKLLWRKNYPLGDDKDASGGPLVGGASLSGNRLLIYRGAQAMILNIENGRTDSCFELDRLRKFPISIDDAYGGYNWWSSSSGGGGWGWRPRPPRYINYLEPGPRGAATSAGLSVKFALAAPAAVWSAGGGGASPRLGMVRGERLLLFGGSGLYVVPAGLPMGGRRVSVAGTLVGLAGDVACLLENGRLNCVDLASGKVRSCNLAELTGGLGGARLGAALDGPLVYVTGPRGILCADLRTGRKVFSTPWPAALGSQPGALVGGESYSHTWRGLTDNNSGECLPLIGRVSGGVLYAAATPSRVVALTGRR